MAGAAEGAGGATGVGVAGVGVAEGSDRHRFAPRHLLSWLSSRAAAPGMAGQTPDAGPKAGPPPGLDETGTLDAPFSSVTMSSLAEGHPPMQPGALFVAIRGARRDGHDFVADAFANGARAALVSRVPASLEDSEQAGGMRVVDFRRQPSGLPGAGEVVAGTHGDARFAGKFAEMTSAARLLIVVDDPLDALQRCAGWWRRQHKARVLAVTGSLGKTTTKELLAHVLQRRFNVLRTRGNFNNELGLPFTLLQLTPRVEKAVLEIGISAIGEMTTFAAIAAPDVAIVTRVAATHLEHLKDVDTVGQEKGRLVATLPADGLAVLNADDERVARMAHSTAAQVLLYGQASNADVHASGVEQEGFTALHFRLHWQGRAEHVQVPLVGRHFVTAALAAAAAAFAEGVSWEDVVAGLSQAPTTRRMQPRVAENGTTLLDDTYNASPAASTAALDLLASLPGRRVAVLGDMFELGDAALAGHRQVGEHVVERTDTLVTVGDLARHIAEGARDAGLPPNQIHVCSSNEEAVALLRARLTGGEYVLVKGSRGMRMDEIVRALAGSPVRTPTSRPEDAQH